MSPREVVYEWSATAARYRDPRTGRFVTRSAIRRGLDDIIQRSQNRITAFSDELRDGVIDLAQWQTAMREEIKETQLAAEALLRGGWKQMTAADYGRAGQRIREQYEYLDGFTAGLRDGVVRTDGSFFVRARMYAAAARVGFHDAQGEQLEALGYTEEKNVLHPAEHCEECVDQTAAGWVPINTLVPIGSRQCLGNDRCSMNYR